MKTAIITSLAIGILFGCGGTSGGYIIEKTQGRKIGKIRYTDYQTLEAATRKKFKDDFDFEVEKKMLPRGGNLYILDKKYWARNPLVSAVMTDGVNKAKCDDFDMKTTNMAAQPTTSGGFPVPFAPPITILNKTKTEIDCKVDAKMTFPARIYFVAMNYDTLATYRITKAGAESASVPGP